MVKNESLFLGILFVIIIFSISLVISSTANPVTITVFGNQITYNNDTPGVTNTSSIQRAIDTAAPGDTIIVEQGVYRDQVNITTSNLTIRSRSGYAVTTITNNSDIVVRIGNTNGANVLLDGFTINSTHNGTITKDAAIVASTVSYCVVAYQTNFTIKNSILQNANVSIYVDSTYKNITLGLIQNNTIQNISAGGGILLKAFSQNMSGITISKNTLSHLNITNYGINITGNNTASNFTGVNVSGDTFGIVIDSNTMNATKYGITIYNVTSVTITNNNITNVSKNGIEIVTLRAVQTAVTNLLNHTITIQSNNVSNYGLIGISMCSAGGFYNTTTTTIDNNIITGPRIGLNYSCTDAANFKMNATNNYWGDISGPSNETDIVGSNNMLTVNTANNVTGNVTYTPWYQDGARTILHSILLSGTYYDSIQHALGNASAGNTITVGAGIYKNGWVNITKNGIILNASYGATVTTLLFNSTNIIEIGSNATDGANVIIDGFTINTSMPTAETTSTFGGIYVRQSNFTIRNCAFNNNNLSIHIDSTFANITYGLIQNNTFKNITANGGILLKTASMNISGITISKNTFSHLNTTNYGINITGNNTASNFTGVNVSGDTFGIVIDSNTMNATKYGITIYNVTSVTITNNNITNVSKNGIEVVTLRKITSNLLNHTITIQSNNITGCGASGLYMCSSGAGYLNSTTYTISSNILVKNTPGLTYGCTDIATIALVASNNWWGSSLGPGNNSLNETADNNRVAEGINNVTGNVTFTPYYKDVNRTISSNQVMIPASQLITTVRNFTGIILNDTSNGIAVTVPRATLNCSLDFGYFVNSTWEANLSMPINVSVNTTSGVVEIQIAANTTFAGTRGLWLGTFNLPAVSSSNVTPTATTGYTQVVTATYEVGYSENLTTTAESNKAVRINFTNQGTKYIGYVKNSAFTEISSTCATDSQSAGNNLTNWTGNCKIVGGNDLIVWTKHFSQYILYTKTATAAAAAAAAANPSGGASVAPAAWTMTYKPAEESFVAGYTKELKANERVEVSVGGSTHHVGVKSLTNLSATIEIASNPVTVTLKAGEDAKVDVDSDGTYDVYVKLNSIANSKADITIKKISEAVPAGEGTVSTTGEQVTGAGGEEETKGTNLTWLWILIGVIVVIAIIGGIAAKKRK